MIAPERRSCKALHPQVRSCLTDGHGPDCAFRALSAGACSACCMLYNVCCMLYVVCCMLYVVCCMLYVVCCMLYVVCCMLYVVCCMLYVVCCMLYAVCYGPAGWLV
jgi:hypothetical protein